MKTNMMVRGVALAMLLLAPTFAFGNAPVEARDLNAGLVARDNDTDELAESNAPAGRSFTARLSAYSHGTRTASGTPVRWGVVAVDPRVVALGSKVMIEGFDTVFVAEDTGGAVRGNHIDIYFPDWAEAIRFGIQHRTVTVLG